jgi:L-ascorbate metabolism protein UlaG (beta-lactamase superfamily)
MKITKFAQSCFLIETKGKKILIDPGTLHFSEEVLNQWLDAEVILITHKHGDHCNEEAIQKIVNHSPTTIYTCQEVSNAFPELEVNIVKEGDMINLEGIKIEVVKAVHGYIPSFKGDKEINESIGFIVDNGEKRVYHTSDSLCFKNDYKCNVLLIAISGHGFIMGAYEGALFAKETEAELVIPCHYDHPKYEINIAQIDKELEINKLNYKFLSIGDQITV